MRKSGYLKKEGSVQAVGAGQSSPDSTEKNSVNSASKKRSTPASKGMKKLLIGDKKYHRILGIDPSSFKIAMCILKDGKPFSLVKFELGKGDIFGRLYELRRRFPKVLDLYDPEFVCIEEGVFIQNPETSRKLSNISGVLMAEVLVRDLPLVTVPPSSWKAKLGVKPLTKQMKEKIIAEMGPKDGRKEIDKLRKSQTISILQERFPRFKWDDHDLADSAGIALYAYGEVGWNPDFHA